MFNGGLRISEDILAVDCTNTSHEKLKLFRTEANYLILACLIWLSVGQLILFYIKV